MRSEQMKDKWYGDNRDLVKWGVLLELTRQYSIKHILQVLFYRPTEWKKIEIDGRPFEIPNGVIRHFRDVRSIRTLDSGIPIDTLTEPFNDRDVYLRQILEVIHAREEQPGIVFLDPDTGLEPKISKYDHSHVSKEELREVWAALRPGDLLVFYQHEDNKRNEEWKNRKKLQFAAALAGCGVTDASVKIAHAPEISRDVVFYFVQRS